MTPRPGGSTGAPGAVLDGGRLRRGRLVFDVVEGGPSHGEPVVLLHGFPQDLTSWHRVAPRLQAAGLRTFALDQRGYSPGARPPGRAAYRTQHLVADVVALLDAAGLPNAHVVGHDWGGVVGWAAAATAGDRVASLTVLSTPHPRAAARALVRSDQALRSAYIAVFQVPWLPEALLRRHLPRILGSTGLPEPDAARYTTRMRRPGAMEAALAWYRARQLSDPVPEVRVPTTYVWGETDFALGPTAAALTGDHVRGPYRFVPLSAGHWLPETRPAEVADAVLRQVGR